MASGRSERVIERLLGACTSVSVLTTVAIVAVLAVGAFGFFAEVRPHRFFLDAEWTPSTVDPRIGIPPLLAGTFVTTAIAAVFAIPLGILSAVYLTELAPLPVRRWLRPALELLAGIPTVVYGYFALILVTPWLQTFIPDLSGYNGLGAGLVLGLLIVPLISSLTQHALDSVPHAIREASHALGASRIRTIVHVVLPTARRAILAAVLHGVSRALGETMIVAIAAGRDPRLTLDPTVPIETMTGYIVQVGHGGVTPGSFAYHSLFAVGAALFVLTFAAHWTARWVGRRWTP